ncbi:MAG TPA: type II toxin-antitoxin system VapC family toxin [Longimicrobiales bacterium]|nr:type II toxin-antitoxin system VapC family toxin [Longimicrobiales bacterium]
MVVDASVVLEVLLQTETGRAVEGRLFGGDLLHAPHLLDLEVAQVLRRHVLRGGLTASRGEGALRDFHDLRIERYPHHPFLGRIWALRENTTAYDAAYLSLAEALEVPLLTTDARLAGAPGHAATVEVVPGR